MENEGINDYFYSFEFHCNQLFDSCNEESENCIEKLECELACLPPFQVNSLIADAPCIYFYNLLMEVCLESYEEGSYKLIEPNFIPIIFGCLSCNVLHYSPLNSFYVTYGVIEHFRHFSELNISYIYQFGRV